MKDYFSGHAKLYAAFRPTYPPALYDFIFTYVTHKNCVWDCATGNGQVAQYLSGHFNQVYATDISAQQLEQAHQAANIAYRVSPAEKTPFPSRQFDLITVGQALHWFDHDAFYKEVRRVGRPGAILAAWGYGLLSITPEIDGVLQHFYHHVVGPYWDNARKLVDDGYQTIPFPFEEIDSPRFFIAVDWNLEQLAGYLESWSSTQKYIHIHQHNPVSELVTRLKPGWPPHAVKAVSFPVFMRMGRVKK